MSKVKQLKQLKIFEILLLEILTQRLQTLTCRLGDTVQNLESPGLYGLSPCLQTLRIDKDGMIGDTVDVMHSTSCLLCKTRDLEGSIRVYGNFYFQLPYCGFKKTKQFAVCYVILCSVYTYSCAVLQYLYSLMLPSIWAQDKQTTFDILKF